MKLTRHGDNLWQLTRFMAFNSYLVREDEGLITIDTNFGGSAAGIVRAAKKIGLPITRITLTHAHVDHAGSLDELSDLLPGVEIAFSQRTADFLVGKMELKADEPQSKLRGSFVRRTTRPTQLLVPGDQLGSLAVLAAPGHTPDQIVFFDERDGTLIAGDAFQTQAGIAVSGVVRWLFPLPALATWHLPTAIETATALSQLNPKRLAVGHGRVLEQPQDAMKEAIAKAKKTANG